MIYLDYILTSFGLSGIRGRQDGATMVEYALIIAVVSIALVFAANKVLDGTLDDLGTAITDAFNDAPGSGVE